MSQFPSTIDATLSELEEIEESPTVKNVLNTLEPAAKTLYSLPITVVVAILTGAGFLFVGSILGYIAVTYFLVPTQICNFLVGVLTLIGLCLGTLFAGGRWQIAKEETTRRLQDEKGQTRLEDVKLERRIEEEKNQILLDKLDKITPWIERTARMEQTDEISQELVENIRNTIQTQLPANAQVSTSRDIDLSLRKQKLLESKFKENFDAIKKLETINKSKITDDLQKGRWGGRPSNNERMISATVEKIPDKNYHRKIIVTVESINPDKNPLTGKVTFHLHPSFEKNVYEENVVDGIARTEIISYGAFTIGAEADNGSTKLELDLAHLDDNQDPFFKR